MSPQGTTSGPGGVTLPIRLPRLEASVCRSPEISPYSAIPAISAFSTTGSILLPKVQIGRIRLPKVQVLQNLYSPVRFRPPPSLESTTYGHLTTLLT
jgi:hypothetical protein